MSIVALETARTSGRMTEAEYDRERAAIPRTKVEAGVRWEQQLARLFYRSGWTGKEIAKKEGLRSSAAITEQIKFGQFLEFARVENTTQPETMLIKLSQWRFRSYWQRIDKPGAVRGHSTGNDRANFRAVLRLMEQEGETGERSERRKKPLSHDVGKAIVANVSPRKWHSPEFMADRAGVPVADAAAFLDGMIRTSSQRAAHGAKVERKKVGKDFHYRIFKQDKAVSVDELIEKLTPIIQALDAEGRKSVVTTIPHEVRCLAARLKKLLDYWAE